MCDQRIKIIREIDPFDDEPAQPKAQIPQNNQAIPIDYKINNPAGQNYPQPQAQTISTQPQTQPTIKLKPKIVTIGDMQVKYDGDKVYQKQWVKLNANEAMNFRIVNDSNNKLISLNGKHIECRKWVIIEEDSNENENDSINALVEGN